MNPLKKLRASIRHHLGIDELLALSRDLHAAQVFHDRILNSPWFTRQRLSPGNYAVDYGFLKTLYNVLSAMQPHDILEFGLGQSSKLVHQYATYFNANALTCENSDDWITFFFQSEHQNTTPIPLPESVDPSITVHSSLGYPVKIRHLPLEKITIRGILTTSYQDVESAFAGQTFDFILVDGPYGEEHFSRPQIISLAEHNLAARFCILIDDSQRPGEQETIAEVKSVLHRRKIPFVTATNSYSKSHTLILSPSLSFLGTT